MKTPDVMPAIDAMMHNKTFGKRQSPLWAEGNTIWSYETAIAYRVDDAVPNEIFINVTKYTNTTTRLQDAIMRHFNPNTTKAYFIASVDDMPPLCHGIDLPRTYYELHVENRSRSDWKMPMGWPTALSEHDLLAHYKRIGHDLTTFSERSYGIFADCCNCGGYITAYMLYYRGEVRYKVTKSTIKSRCQFAETMQHA